MADNYVVAVQGLSALDSIAELPAEIATNASRALNKTIERARAGAARQMRSQVNFPAHYLSGEDGRLKITKRATGQDLEAIVTGRHRPTSLSRFATTARLGLRNGVNVAVQPGLAKRLPRAFFIQLRAGAARTDTKNNLGLAIRLPEGKHPDRAYKPTQIGKNLWLLYGPSVDQVFDDVANDIAPEMTDFLEAEFLRLMGLN